MSSLAFHMPIVVAYLKITEDPQLPQKQPGMLYVKESFLRERKNVSVLANSFTTKRNVV